MGSEVIIGGKDSPLTSSLLSSVVNSKATVKCDPSSLEKLSRNLPRSPTLPKDWKPDPIPLTLSKEESRACLVVFLHKLLITTTGIRHLLPGFIAQALNEGFNERTFDFGSGFGFFHSLFEINSRSLLHLGVTDGELLLFKNSHFVTTGICAVVDYSLSSLSSVVDVVAALSCEALKADVSGVVNSRAGLKSDDAAVIRDFKVLLDGSKLITEVKSSDNICMSGIPLVHGSLREVLSSLKFRVEVELNSSDMEIEDVDYGLRMAFSSTAISLLGLGDSVLRRVRWLLNSNKLTQSPPAQSDLNNWSKELKDYYGFVFKALTDSDYVKFFHDIYFLLWCRIRLFISWEASLALLVLDKNDISEKGRVGGVPSLGTGTAIIRKLLKERLEEEGAELDDSDLTACSASSEDFRLLFDPKRKGHDILLNKVKEIISPTPQTPEEPEKDIKLPHDYEDIIKRVVPPIDSLSKKQLLEHFKAGVFLDAYKKKYWIDESGTNSFMLFPRDCWIYELDSKWTMLKDKISNMNVEAAELVKTTTAIRITGTFKTSNLTPATIYEVVFLHMLKDQARGWDLPMTFYLTLPEGAKQEKDAQLPITNKGQWTEIQIGEFYRSSSNTGSVSFQIDHFKGVEKIGLVVQGIILRPKKK